MYFCDTYCQILSDSGQGGDWVPFRLWPEQQRVARLLQENRLVVVLKARQLGLTWLVVAFALWLLLFHPIATVLLFSRRDDEAVDLLAVRLRGMHDRLPAWLKASSSPPTTTTSGRWSAARGRWPSRRRPATATRRRLAIVDEADLCPDLDRLMRAVKPTIDGGGRMILLSRADKSKPESTFKQIYRSAAQGPIGLAADLLALAQPARPGRRLVRGPAARRVGPDRGAGRPGRAISGDGRGGVGAAVAGQAPARRVVAAVLPGGEARRPDGQLRGDVSPTANR